MSTRDRIPTPSLRVGDRVRVEEFPPGDGWHPAKRKRTSKAGTVTAIRDLGPTVAHRYRVTVRLDGDGGDAGPRLVMFHAPARSSQMRADQ